MKKYDELTLKLMLTLARDRRAMQGRIRNVGFMREYLTLPDDLGVHTLSQMSEQEIEELAQSISIKPKSEVAKFHFYLNDVRCHLVHRVNNGFYLTPKLDEEAWALTKQHAQATALNDNVENNKPMTIPLQSLNPHDVAVLLNYVLFIGNEKGAALHQAESVFIFEDALNMNSWTIMDKEQAINYATEHGYIQIDIIDGKAMYSIIVSI